MERTKQSTEGREAFLDNLKFIALVPTAPIIFGIAAFFAWMVGKSIELPDEEVE